MALTNHGRTPGPAGTFRDLEDDIVFSHPEARPRLPGPSGTGLLGPLFSGGSGGAQSLRAAFPTVKLEEPESGLVIGGSYDLLPEIAPPFIGQPKPDDVVQGGLPNCPLHAILVAMAHAKPEILSNMLSRTLATVISTLAYYDPKFPKQTDTLITVQFHDAKPIEISTLLYYRPVNKGGEDDDKGGGLVYAGSNNGSWVSFFEKAYVKEYSKNSYKILANTGIGDAGKVMANVAGPHLVVDLLKNDLFRPSSGGVKQEDLSDKLLANILKDAKQRPTIAGSPKTVPDQKIVGHHGYGVLEFDGTKVHLRNPWGENAAKPAVVLLSLADFKKNFIVVLQATS